MLRNNLSKPIGLAALTILLVALPFFLGEYDTKIMIMLFINLILVVSLRLIHTTGGFNLAHIPVMGIGAYGSAILATSFGWPFWLTLPLGGLAAALFGLMISYPLARVKAFGFFIASYAFGEAMRLSWTRLKVPFGAHWGIVEIPRPGAISLFGLGTIDFTQTIPYYFLAVVVTALCLFIMYWLERSRIGDTFKAIASEDSLSKSVGINSAYYKMLAFVVGSFFAGIAGVLFAHLYRAIDPKAFGFVNTIYLVVWVIFGGLHTFVGPMLGLTVMTVVHELLSPLYQWRPLFYGVILISTLLFLPGGLESVPKEVSKWVRKVRGAALGE